MIASDSKTATLPSCSDGHFPVGAYLSMFARVSGWSIGMTTSWNGILSCASRIQGLSDHEE
jgi:hypothetical protein